MKKTFYKTLVTIFTAFVLIVPLMTFAAPAANSLEGRGIVPNCRHMVNGRELNACGYTDLIQLGINVMGFAIYMMAILSVLSFVYAGYLYMSSGGDSGAIKKAHAIFGKVAFGIFFTLGAWLIVHQITVWLGVKSGFTLLQ
jgi:hypothetical protein